MLDEQSLSLLELDQKGYHCSQILLLLALRSQGRENPGLVRAMAGLARGTAREEGTCGTLTGAAGMMAYYAAKGGDDEQERMELPVLLEELWDWFETTYGKTFGGTTCSRILADGTHPRERCGRMVLETFRQCQAILMAYGIDPLEDTHG
jgi:hypothetical protein